MVPKMQLFAKKKKKKKKKKKNKEKQRPAGKETDEKRNGCGEEELSKNVVRELKAQPAVVSRENEDQASKKEGKTFASLGLAPWIQRSCRSLGMRMPTEVQSSCIPRTLEGDDVCGCASTGSGKTAAFALPILQKLAKDPYGVYALVLTPARELAFQIADQFKALGTAGRGLARLRVAVIIGGLDHTQQSVELSKRPHIVVATPGRLARLLRDQGIRKAFARLRFFVLDEADRLLEPHAKQIPDVTEIARAIPPPKRRQTLLYSATMPRWGAEDSAGIGESNGTQHESRTGTGGRAKGAVLSYEYDDEALGLHALRARSETKGEASAPPRAMHFFGTGASVEESGIGGDAVSVRARLPTSLRHEYVFVPSHVKLAHFVHVLECAGHASVGGRHGPFAKSDESEFAVGSDGRRSASADVRAALKAAKNGVASAGAASSTTPASGGGDPIRSLIVFVSRVEECELLSQVLRELGVSCVALHSGMPQRQRMAALAKFRGEAVRRLVCTDVAARGLDIPVVDLVLNYDVPVSWVDYVHRAGRTARAGRRGRAVTFVSQYDISLLQSIETALGKQLSLCEWVAPERDERSESDEAGEESGSISDEAEKRVVAILNKVGTALRVAKMRLADSGFEERREEARRRNRERDRRQREEQDVRSRQRKTAH